MLRVMKQAAGHGEGNMISTQQTISSENTVAWSGKQLAAEIHNEVVLMDVERGCYYGLDDIGSEIWRAVENPVAVHSLCQSLAEKYKADPAIIASDVLTLLNNMHARELIVVCK
jgi:Coenzyme PQQ synthesis protein D (PqqD)